MSDRPSVSAVVATFNRRDMLPSFIEALLVDDALTELVVAVDGSDDGSIELAQDYCGRDGRVTPLWVDHRGQFGALDAGAAVAEGEVVLFLDDDVHAAPNMVAGHARHHAEADDLVVLGYMPPAIDPHPSASDYATVMYGPEYEKRCEAYDRDPQEVLRHLWGGNFSLRRKDYTALGYTPLEAPAGSPPLRMYNQDRDFGLRCLDAGMTGRFDRRIRAVHRHQRNTEGFLRDAYGQGACEALLHHLHPEVLGPFDLERYERGLPAPARRLVAAAGVDGPRGERAAAVGARCIATAERVGSLRAAVAAAKVARRINQRRGAVLMSGLLGHDAGDPATSPPRT